MGNGEGKITVEVLLLLCEPPYLFHEINIGVQG
jgi:hypothetical protein